MAAVNPYQQYKEQSLSTLAPGELLVKLYEQLIKQMHLGKIGIEKSDFAVANDALTKSQTIVSTLAASLDMRYPISQELKDMYIFLAQQLMKANMQKNAAILENCLPLVKDLRDSFDQADKLNRKQQAHVGGKAV